MIKIEEQITKYFNTKKEVIAVYLFGSYAADKERNSSDVDIGIFLDGRAPDFFAEKRNEYIVELGRVLRKDIDPVILNSASTELLRQVFFKGNCILVKDVKKLARYKTFIFAEIAEMGYYRGRMQSGFIRKVREAK